MRTGCCSATSGEQMPPFDCMMSNCAGMRICPSRCPSDRRYGATIGAT
jgi:hypothetical protein